MSLFTNEIELENTSSTPVTTDNNSNNCVIEFNFGVSGFDTEYNAMVDKWMELYNDDNIKKFTLVFKACDEGASPPLSYVYRLSKFLKDIKKRRKTERDKYNKLEQSVVMITSKTIKLLLDTLFKLVTPLSTIYIVSTNEHIYTIVECIEHQRDIPENIKGIKCIRVK